MSRDRSSGPTRSGAPGTCRSCTGPGGFARRSRDPCPGRRRGVRTARLRLVSSSVIVAHRAHPTMSARSRVWSAPPDQVVCRLVDRPNDAAGASDVGSAPTAAGPTVVVVMPAYNAAKTLERTYADIPHELVDRIILVDDVSHDETVDVANQLGLDVI